jgi:lysophospholipid acyltransferase (LPLAT)-like uncharacterized protein
MAKGWGRGALAAEALGFLLAQYLRLVRRTNSFVIEPPDPDAFLSGRTPVIVARWHGQHLMVPFAQPKAIERAAALISRHEDAGAQAVALRRLGVAPVRGSGGQSHRFRDKGGAPAMLALRRLLASGVSVAMTADVPKRARVSGPGIVALARLTGRPIMPTAVVTSRRFDFDSWDRASLGKPFGRGAIIFGDLIDVAADADPSALEAARLAVQNGLDAVHARAYAIIGARDPGAGLRPP